MLRGILFDNLGLKLVALLLALVVYLNVYTERPATMRVRFPLQISGLPDSLSLLGPAPEAVEVELKGRAKQLIRLRVTEPPLRISLAAAAPGRYERVVGIEDLPLPQDEKLEVNRIVSPRVLELNIDRKGRRSLPAAARIVGNPAGGFGWDGEVVLEPRRVTAEGPETALAELDSIVLRPVTIEGKRDTVRAVASPAVLPPWTRVDPAEIEVTVPIEGTVTRRLRLAVEPPAGQRGLHAVPGVVTALVSAPRRLAALRDFRPQATWAAPRQPERSSHAAVRLREEPPEGVRVRFEPDSVRIERNP